MTDDMRDSCPWFREIGRTRWKASSGARIGYLLDGFDIVLITLVLTEVSEEFGLDPVEAASLSRRPLPSAGWAVRCWARSATGTAAERRWC
ncbi:hypothetical protein [Streptomyces anulatus]|uniref:hypothetical protein n=1 Tax=Streptomyces anulatus TaxID=1892 RepID=UPI003660E1C0